ncbi:hypothetical protein BSKO_13821 [Bryopsis sp. KO-2023]|nr:hypothetical protein BSKO_13821 [Bryopsis sp. KO-2023]
MESEGGSGSLAKTEGASSSRPEIPDNRVDVLIRTTTPGTSKDLTLKLELATTVAGLKDIIRAEHKDSPAPKDQVLILAGKVLKDADATLGEVLLKLLHTGGPHSIHLVVKETDPAPAKFKFSERSWSSNGTGAGGSGSGDGRGSSGSGSASATSRQRDGAGTSTRSTTFRRVPRSRPTPEPSSSISAPPPQPQASNVAVVPQGAVAVPYMMVNPVVSAAYSAAFAAMSNGNAHAPLPGMSVPSLASVSPPSTTAGAQPQASTSGAVGQSEQRQQGLGQPPQQALPPFIPAIAFFPLGVPMLVPAATPPQGFQVHQQYIQPTLQPGHQYTPPNTHPPQYPHQPNMPNNAFQGGPIPAPARHHHHHHGPGQPPRRRRRRVVMYRISIRGLLQLILMLTVLYAYTSRGRFLALVGLFCVLYLAARPLRRILSHITRGGVGGGGRPAQGQPRSFIQEILTLVLGFVTSVFPAWNVNVQDEAAFAAAQELVNREDRERARNQPENRNQNENVNAQGGNAHAHQD